MNHADLITKKGKRLLESYIVGRALPDGTGKHGETRKCKNRSSKTMRLVKIVNKESMDEEELVQFEMELEKIKSMNQDLRIVELIEVYEDEKRWYLVTEMDDGIPFFEKIAKMSEFGEKEAASIIE